VGGHEGEGETAALALRQAMELGDGLWLSPTFSLSGGLLFLCFTSLPFFCFASFLVGLRFASFRDLHLFPARSRGGSCVGGRQFR
jgi:hypothetical protein